ncbi:MAG TPA: hypothetical protein DCS93_22310 [Microscillaceae bacterium]|nr:hypothetical protein [Microscillaceae bacterium]
MFPLQHRPLIISIAYSILGSYTDAEDVAQDVAEKWLILNTETIQDEKNYLIRLTINHCLNQKKQQQRLEYKGLWLPEPVQDKTLQLDQVLELRDLLNYELTTQLSRLSPYERAVFILKEAFDFPHQEIAQIIQKSPDNTRQLFRRAKGKVQQPVSPSPISAEDQAKAYQFAHYIQQGDLEQLITLFKEDITIYSDGGGKVTAALLPIVGAQKVAGFYLNIAQNISPTTQVRFEEVLGQPAIILSENNQIWSVVIFTLEADKISTIYSILNPEKLKSL